MVKLDGRIDGSCRYRIFKFYECSVCRCGDICDFVIWIDWPFALPNKYKDSKKEIEIMSRYYLIG